MFPLRYTEDKLLGTGTFGTVTRAYDEVNDLTLAIKKIFIGNSDSKSLLKIKNETQML